jgi:hypothetical protein
MPPISIDGTDVSDITIDGDSVTEVTADGDVVWTADSTPDSVVDRPSDNRSDNDDLNLGLKFETSENWTDFQARISSNTSTASDEEMVIGDTNGNDVAVKDVSSKSSNDVVTFNSVNLSANTVYSIFMRSSNARDRGFYDSPSFPYTSSDGNLSITAGWFDGPRSGTAYSILEIGNINL